MKLRVRWFDSRREREHGILKWAQWLFFVAGVLALGFCALAYFEAVFWQASERRAFEKSLALPEPVRPARQANAVIRLEIPRLGLFVMVHEGVQSGILRLGAGHIPGTASPGEVGNVGIAAHRDTFFRELRNVRSKDTVLLATLEGTYQYSVEWTRVVKPSQNEVLAASDDPVLTLVTCYPFYYVGSASERFVVRARRVGWTR
jgi:sortase A